MDQRCLELRLAHFGAVQVGFSAIIRKQQRHVICFYSGLSIALQVLENRRLIIGITKKMPLKWA